MREEDFGLLFYTMAGPRLFFLGSGKLLGTGFFNGNYTVGQWIAQEGTSPDLPREQITRLKEGLASLRAKGVLVEC